MAERRMFAKTVIDSDAFLDMPLSAQALYFHLSMRADDDGFINNPKKIQRMIGASDDDCKLLVMKRFILVFDSGVIVIKHWRLHNYIQKDRYKPTIYQEEKAQLLIKDNKTYTDNLGAGISNVYNTDTQDRLSQDNIGKYNNYMGENPIAELPSTENSPEEKPKRKRFVPPTIEEVKAYCKERNNNVDAEKFVNYYTSNGWQVGKNKMKDWKAAVRTWENNGYSSQAQNKNTDNSKKSNYDYDALAKKAFLKVANGGGNNG